MKNYKYLDLILGLFVCVLLVSNIVSTKIVSIGGISFDGGTLLFPISYIFGDILTEVYGYKISKRIIWIGFVCALIMSFNIILVGFLPASSEWHFQQDYNNILGMTPRIVLASLIAYLLGQFVNSYVLAKMKIWTKGKHLWTRTIGSTLVGEFFDTLVFISIAFGGLFSTGLMIGLFVSNYILKVLVEVFFTPITYKIVGFLKKTENLDFYDYKTDFNPLKFE